MDKVKWMREYRMKVGCRQALQDRERSIMNILCPNCKAWMSIESIEFRRKLEHKLKAFSVKAWCKKCHFSGRAYFRIKSERVEVIKLEEEKPKMSRKEVDELVKVFTD